MDWLAHPSLSAKFAWLHYVQKARSAIYGKKTDTKPLSSIDAFHLAARKRPEAAKVWLERLRPITRSDYQSLFKQVPPTEISETAIQFALTMLELNQKRLLLLKDNLTP